MLTFTKVAAEEIKSRLTNAILSQKPTKELIESLDVLPLSDISTIDSFCEKIIKRNKPKLAVCIYHSDQDMLEIIQYIHQLVPEYKLYVRQHSNMYYETVLYAVYEG